MQVSLTAFSEEIGRPGVNGLLYGVFAAGNMLAGIACGAIAWKSSPRRRLIVGYVALTLTASGLWAVHSVPLLAGLGLLVGLCIAPALISGYTLVEALVPQIGQDGGLHLADGRCGARPGGRCHGGRTARGLPRCEHRFRGAAAGNGAGAGNPAGPALTADTEVPGADGGTWDRSPRAGHGGLIARNTSVWNVVSTH